jgi:hypothetical protein
MYRLIPWLFGEIQVL